MEGLGLGFDLTGDSDEDYYDYTYEDTSYDSFSEPDDSEDDEDEFEADPDSDGDPESDRYTDGLSDDTEETDDSDSNDLSDFEHELPDLMLNLEESVNDLFDNIDPTGLGTPEFVQQLAEQLQESQGLSESDAQDLAQLIADAAQQSSEEDLELDDEDDPNAQAQQIVDQLRQIFDALQKGLDPFDQSNYILQGGAVLVGVLAVLAVAFFLLANKIQSNDNKDPDSETTRWLKTLSDALQGLGAPVGGGTSGTELGSGTAASRMTTKEATEAAADLGYTRRVPPQKLPFDSRGQPGFFDGNRYISPDVTSHKGGVWKMFDRNGTRLGTFDANLNKIAE